MVDLVFQWLDAGGIKDAILVTPNEELKSYCQQHHPAVEVVLPEAFTGTADALRAVKDKINVCALVDVPEGVLT